MVSPPPAKKVYGREFIQRFLHMMSLCSLSAAPDDLRQTVQTLLFLVQLCHENQRSMTDWLKAQEVSVNITVRSCFVSRL